MLLRHSLNLDDEALAIEHAVNATLDQGVRTADISDDPDTTLSTTAFTDQVLAQMVVLNR